MNLTGLTSSYEQTQYMESDIQTQGRVTWGDRFLNDRLTLDAAIFFEDRQYSKDEVQAAEIDELVEKKFGGSLPAFIAAFTRHRRLSCAELDEMQRMIDEYREGGGDG